MAALLHVHLCVTWTIAPIDRVAATTTVRLWHDLHSSALKSHDFTHLLAPPPPEMTFVAVLQHDEMRAVAYLLQRDADGGGPVRLHGVAYHPYYPRAATELIERLCGTRRLGGCDKSMRAQHRILFEVLYQQAADG